jgi:hypothetical protein
MPIKRWDQPWLIRSILRRQNARIPAPTTPSAVPARQPPQHSPGVPRFDMDELVAGYRCRLPGRQRGVGCDEVGAAAALAGVPGRRGDPQGRMDIRRHGMDADD